MTDTPRKYAAAHDPRDAIAEPINGIRSGAPQAIGYGPETQKIFAHGWNANAERLFALAVERGLVETEAV